MEPPASSSDQRGSSSGGAGMRSCVSTCWTSPMRAGGDELADPREERVEGVVERLQHRDAGRLGSSGDLPGLGRVGRERLLRQHVLARLDGPEVPRAVQRVGQRVVDRLDLRVGQQVLVGLVDPLDAVLLRERGGPLRVAGGHGHEAVPRGRGRLHDAELRDAGRAQDADAQRLGAGARGHSAFSASSSVFGGEAQALHLVELLVLVLDVDGHVRVDLLQRAQELGPVGRVVPAARPRRSPTTGCVGQPLSVVPPPSGR